MSGYAVVDVETTGLFPGGCDRVVEVGVVQVDARGEVECEWTTLVNPGRDLGPQHVHRIEAADVLGAPTFAQIAGHLAGLLRGRLFVAHNASFDRRFITAEYAGLGWDVPVVEATCLCTMQWAGSLLPGAPRSLAGCCEWLGIEHQGAHAALADAVATASLLRHYLTEVGLPRHAPPWSDALELAALTPWPAVPTHPFTPVLRGSGSGAAPFLSRLTDRLPRGTGPWEHEQYLAMLDRALLDRVLSVREQDSLVAVATELGIDRATAGELHRGYLRGLAVAAWADGEVTSAERDDLCEVASLLSLPETEVDDALDATGPGTACPVPQVSGFRLTPGATIVFTGDMCLPRDEWIARAEAAGLTTHSSVTKKVSLVVAADPDSLSGKARKAADYGIPIVTEKAFASMLDAFGETP